MFAPKTIADQLVATKMSKQVIFLLLILWSEQIISAPELRIAFLHLNDKYEVWQLDQFNKLSKLVNEKHEVTYLSSYDFGLVYKTNSMVKSYNTNNGTIRKIFEFDKNMKSTNIAIDNKLEYLLLSYFNKRHRKSNVRIYNLRNDVIKIVDDFGRIPLHAKWIHAFSFIYGDDIVEIDTRGKQSRTTLPPSNLTGNITDFSYTSDKSIIALELYDDKKTKNSMIVLFKKRKLHIVAELSHASGISLSRDGNYLVYTSTERKGTDVFGRITIFDTNSMKNIKSIRTTRPASFPVILGEPN